MKSSATTVKDYLASLPVDRRAGIEAIRKVILKNLDEDYEESMQWGMIGYAVPHRVWPLGYHCDPKKPLLMAALSSQKNCLTVYLMSVYSQKSERAWFQSAWAKSGKRLSMGGCCIRFKTVGEAALDVIGEAIRRTPAKAYVEQYVTTLASTGRGPDGKKLAKKPSSGEAVKPVAKSAAKKSAAKKSAAKKSATKKSVTKKSVTTKSATQRLATKPSASTRTAAKKVASKATKR